MNEKITTNETKPQGDSGGSSSTSKRISILNEPFGVTVLGGLIILAVTSFVQHIYWKAQEKYLYQQETMKFKLATIDETVRSVDELLSAYGDEFTAYESDFSPAQKHSKDLKLDAASSDWDKDFGLRNLRIQIYFRDDKNITDAWDQVENSDLGTLDCYMDRLGKNKIPTDFDCGSLGLENLRLSAVIAKGRPLVDQTEEDMEKLAKLMDDYARNPPR